jgi:hypothetical protein
VPTLSRQFQGKKGYATGFGDLIEGLEMGSRG